MTPAEMPGDLTTPQPGGADQRVGLCLSGGGYRAALFHLGALRRLNELGVLSHLDAITSVSGGSILAGHLATQVRPWPAAGQPFEQWQERVEQPLCRLTQTNIRTWPLLKRFLLPWNWFRPSTQAQVLEGEYQRQLTSLVLPDLPEQPRFIFCATDMVFGVLWVFERGRVGSYKAGYLTPVPAWPLARAVAASSCFPPVFSPLPMVVPAGAAIMGRMGEPMPTWDGMSVSDGGLYDNLGLQPMEPFGTVLVSDGGQPFVAAVPRGMLGRGKAYLNVLGRQAGALRKQDLISRFRRHVKKGTYWGVGSAVGKYQPGSSTGYSEEFASSVIARIRTDLDAFSDAEIAVLMNHGYLLADIALAVHAPHLIVRPTEQNIPYPEWMDERRAGEALRDSHKRRWLGRRF